MQEIFRGKHKEIKEIKAVFKINMGFEWLLLCYKKAKD